MKNLLIAAFAAASLTVPPGVLAHGAAEPRHGGIVQGAGELSF